MGYREPMHRLLVLALLFGLALGQGGFVGGDRQSYALYIEWVDTQGSLTGQMVWASAEGSGPYSVKVKTYNLEGTRSGSKVVLNVGGFMGSRWLGTLQGRTLQFNLTADDGSLFTLSLTPGGNKDYNTLLGALQNQVAQLNRVVSSQQEQLQRQQAFEHAAGAVQDGIQELSDYQKAVQLEHGNLKDLLADFPPILEELNQQYQNLQGEFDKAKDEAAPPLSCYTRDANLPYAVNANMGYEVHSNMNYSLNSNFSYAEHQFGAQQERVNKALQTLLQRSTSLADQLNDLKTALAVYPQGKSTYDSLVKGVQTARSKVKQYADPLPKGIAELASTVPQYRKGAERIYADGEQLLKTAQAWLAEIQKQDCSD